MASGLNQIWLGPVLGHNRARLIESCSQLVASNRSDEFLYLAASRPLLELVTQQTLDGQKNRGVWGELPVYLFRGFVRRILTTSVDAEGQRLPPRIPIDRDELPLKRCLISQVLAQLQANRQLKALEPLASRDGCINTISTLVGEIQRAGKSPEELTKIVADRKQDLSAESTTGKSQIDYDHEVALIYSTYSALLERNLLTEDDADQLRALNVLRGQAQVPWLKNVKLLILDGFFDFTPVQGEILRNLIPAIPETLVNLDYDERNPEIFLPFQQTIEQLGSIASFETKRTSDQVQTSGVLSRLRANLFNTQVAVTEDSPSSSDSKANQQTDIRYLECGDRDTEIRTIAREIKRLVLSEKYSLADIALVVRQRASYAATIARVMHKESVPCNLEPRVDTKDVPAIRAVLKLLDILEEISSGAAIALRVSPLADLIKSEYFRLGDADLESLSKQFDETYLDLLESGDRSAHSIDDAKRLKLRHRIGLWDADALENAFAYVGSELPVGKWLDRAGQLIRELPHAEATKEILNIDSGAIDRDADIADQLENAETAKLEDKGVARKRRPSKDIHPAALAWTSLVIRRFAELIQAVPQQATPASLRLELMRLLESLQFREQIARPVRQTADDHELPQVMLNFNGLECLRRAFVASIKSIELGAGSARKDVEHVAQLATFIAEVRRALASQTQIFGAADRAGLRVLEATDIRGLKFRAVFVAGLVEGGFPLRASRDWIYPHEERDRLKRYGLILEDISPATLLKEEHYFYQVACRASERLYLTRPLLLDDDAETVASYYIDELRRAIAPSKIIPETIRRDYDGKNITDVSSASELRIALVRQQERHRHQADKAGLLPKARVKKLLTLARNDGLLTDEALRRIEIERERSDRGFGPYDGQITDPDLLRLLRLKFGDEFVHSASGLSVYGNCGYRFFAQRLLRLEPRGEAALDLQAIDAGKLLHDILRRFFEQHRRRRLNATDRETLQNELREIADKVFDEHQRVVPPLNRQIWQIDREIRKILLDQILLYEMEVQEEASELNVLPALFEVAFGNTRSSAKDPGSTPQPLELTRGTFVGDESIKISGQIDRVDLADDDTLIAYDYKLSTGSTKEDIRSGRSLQIPIYLEALEKLLLPESRVAGGGYYIIRGARDRRNKGLHRKSDREYSRLGHGVGALLSDEEWQQIRDEAIARLWEFVDGMRAGTFAVNPAEGKKTCRFCDYRAVCRYERYRIQRKKKESVSTDYTDYTD
ncbi:MAG TPA: PD-(D/E)XK nuclease family protein [Pyrinomonadaceae bacterium]|nr:PD-(D/E)XK nuclease family protein [Pyrinomonadaceae bacterium]